jgi:L-ascorbate metabolism protein UlaG (beta-lactamase superfamily)
MAHNANFLSGRKQNCDTSKNYITFADNFYHQPMKKLLLLTLCAAAFINAFGAKNKESMKKYKTPTGEIVSVRHVGHASLVIEFGGKTIHVDPWSEQGDYSALPKADLVLITHEHHDHLDKKAIGLIKTPTTEFIVSKSVADAISGARVLRNGDATKWNGIAIEAYPAYNVVNKKPDGQPYHPKGNGNGYLLDFGGFKIYIGGDTEDVSEFKALSIKKIDVAFLPKNLPYTMTDAMFINAAKMIKPATVCPYHYFELDNADQIRKELSAAGVNLLIMSEL